MNRPFSSFGRQLAACLPWIVGVVCLAPFHALLLPDDRVISDPRRDYAALHLPLRQFAREELLSGRLPLWNPYFGCGQPVHAAQQASLCYPLLTPLVLVCGPNAGLKVGLFLHLAICFTGAYLLARRLEVSNWGASYAALVATWCGAMLGHLAEGHVTVVVQQALTPWFMLALISLLHAPGPLAALRLAGLSAMFVFAGHSQILYYMVLVGSFWTVGALVWPRAGGRVARAKGDALTTGHKGYRAASQENTVRGDQPWNAGHTGLGYYGIDRRIRCAMWLAVAALTCALLSAVQLLPTLELLRDGLADSGRGVAGFASTYAMDGVDTGRLVLPYLNGNPFARWAQFDAIDHYHERVVYFGLAAPLLAAFSMTRACVARWQWLAAWLVVLSLAVAYGDSTPAFDLLERLLPGLSLFRCPGRVFCVTSIFVALLAGRGLDCLASGVSSADRRQLLPFIAALVAAIALPVYAAIWSMPDFDWQHYLAFARRNFTAQLIASALILVDVVLLFAIAKGFRPRGAAVPAALLVLTAADLGYFNVQCFRLEPPADMSIPATLLAKDPPIRFVEAAGYPHVDYDTLRYSRFAGAAVVHHRAAVGTDDGGVLSGATARLYRAIAASAPEALAVAACDYTCAPAAGAWNEIKEALPRVRFLPDEKSHLLNAPVDKIDKAALERLRASTAANRCVWSAAPRRLEVTVDARQAGWLVVADTLYPGWKCSVDGTVSPIEPVHGVFRGVRLTRGQHEITMSYEPRSVYSGMLGTAAGVLAGGVLLAMEVVYRRLRIQTDAPVMAATEVS